MVGVRDSWLYKLFYVKLSEGNCEGISLILEKNDVRDKEIIRKSLGQGYFIVRKILNEILGDFYWHGCHCCIVFVNKKSIKKYIIYIFGIMTII